MKPESKTELSRRELFQAFRKPSPAETNHEFENLPWAFDQSIFANCTGCGDCVAACPEDVIKITANQRATVDFQAGECTFCEKCAEVCEEDVFLSAVQRKETPPWQAEIEISKSCMAYGGIVCQVCRDQCLEKVISFPPIKGATALPILDLDTCSGCGACVSSCPVAAITIQIQTADFSHSNNMKTGA